MAYMSQEHKTKLAPAIKALCAKYGVKASLAVRHHSTLVLNIKSAKIDFIKNANDVAEVRGTRIVSDGHIQVNPYWCHEHFSGDAKEFMVEMVKALKGPEFFDHSDIQSDYFNCSHYVAINVGSWDKPFTVTA